MGTPMPQPGPERFAIIELPPGPAPAESILVGSLDMLMEQIPDSIARKNAMARLEDARISADEIARMQDATRGILASTLADAVTTLARRLDNFEARRAEQAIAEAKERNDRERQQIQERLDALPNPDDPDNWDYHPGGDLHSVAPSAPEDRKQLAASEDDDQPVPLSYGKLPLSYVKSEAEGDLPRELTKEVPVDPGTEPEFSGTREPTAKNPVGISW